MNKGFRIKGQILILAPSSLHKTNTFVCQPLGKLSKHPSLSSSSPPVLDTTPSQSQQIVTLLLLDCLQRQAPHLCHLPYTIMQLTHHTKAPAESQFPFCLSNWLSLRGYLFLIWSSTGVPFSSFPKSFIRTSSDLVRLVHSSALRRDTAPWRVAGT